jgi:hypothetical protein
VRLTDASTQRNDLLPHLSHQKKQWSRLVHLLDHLQYLQWLYDLQRRPLSFEPISFHHMDFIINRRIKSMAAGNID